MVPPIGCLGLLAAPFKLSGALFKAHGALVYALSVLVQHPERGSVAYKDRAIDSFMISLVPP